MRRLLSTRILPVTATLFAMLVCVAGGAAAGEPVGDEDKGAEEASSVLEDELLEDVSHTLWTFTIPKSLRPYFMNHRELLGDLARLAYETIQELMGTISRRVLPSFSRHLFVRGAFAQAVPRFRSHVLTELLGALIAA